MQERCPSAAFTDTFKEKSESFIYGRNKKCRFVRGQRLRGKILFEPGFKALPENIKKELQILCVLYTHKVGGILLLEFDEGGSLIFRTEAKENDFAYDEVGSVLEIKSIQREKRELLEELEMFYKVVFLGESYEDA